MKNVLLALFTLALCFSSLFANEAAVKQTIIRDLKLTRDFNLVEALNYYTTDYVSNDLDKNEKMYYKDLILLAKAVDGKHPVEFLIAGFKVDEGREPNAQEMKKVREIARTADFAKMYAETCKELRDIAKKIGDLELKTLKFINVTVKGNTAIAVTEYQTYDSEDMKTIIKKRATLKFRKVNGVWKYCENSSKKISR